MVVIACVSSLICEQKLIYLIIHDYMVQITCGFMVIAKVLFITQQTKQTEQPPPHRH